MQCQWYLIWTILADLLIYRLHCPHEAFTPSFRSGDVCRAVPNAQTSRFNYTNFSRLRAPCWFSGVSKSCGQAGYFLCVLRRQIHARHSS